MKQQDEQSFWYLWPVFKVFSDVLFWFFQIPSGIYNIDTKYLNRISGKKRCNAKGACHILVIFFHKKFFWAVNNYYIFFTEEGNIKTTTVKPNQIKPKKQEGGEKEQV